MNAIENFYKQYYKLVLSYLYGLTNNYQAAEELTQETFYQVVKSFYTFRHDSKVTTWIYGIARNVYYKWKSKNKTQPIEINTIEKFSNNTAYNKYCPESAFEIKEKKERIMKTLSILPEHHREVIILRDWHGNSYEQISNITGHSLSWVKVNIYRARRSFRNIYNEEENQNEN